MPGIVEEVVNCCLAQRAEIGANLPRIRAKFGLPDQESAFSPLLDFCISAKNICDYGRR
jgi:hypothetical protein